MDHIYPLYDFGICSLYICMTIKTTITIYFNFLFHLKDIQYKNKCLHVDILEKYNL